MSSALRWYLAGLAAILVPGGINMVLFPWLVAVHLAESAQRLGVAQMAGQLPGLALILVGGVLGDRFDQRRLLILGHVIAAVPPLLLLAAIETGLLSYGLLVLYTLALGAIGACFQPSRDALLTRVAGGRVQHTVTIVLGLQFSVQILGFVLAALADTVGPVPLLATSAMITGAGALAMVRMRIPDEVSAVERSHPLRAIVDGLAYVANSRSLLPVMVLTLGIGVFFAGTYVVLIPLTIRDVYGGAAAEIALAFVVNVSGTVLVTIALVMRGGIVHQGRAFALALLSGSIVLLPLCFGVAESVFYVLLFLWGMGAGVCMTMGRTIAQEAAPVSHRARIMSVYSLGFMGGMPIGSLIMGYAAGGLGPQAATWVPVIGMALLTGAVVATTGIWSLLPPPASTRV